MLSLRRMNELAELRKKRKEERERKRKEREKEKKRQKSLARKKRIKKKCNRRYYLKVKAREEEELKARGDEKGIYTIIITQNRKRIRTIKTIYRKLEAYKFYNDMVEHNRKTVSFPKTTFNKNRITEPIKYEILLVKKVKKGEDTTAMFKNEDGKYVENIVIWDGCRKMLEKNDWLVEEKFGVYGYHPFKDKKTYAFILNDLILGKVSGPDDMRRILLYKNRLIIQYLEDFDIVTCYDENESLNVYDKLQTDIEKLKVKYVVFMGKVSKASNSTWIDRIEEKTGWERHKLFHRNTIV